MDGPPPPPPHGENPKTTSGTGLPPGKYDIFIIPPHSSGSGFLYLPSLKPNTNAFAAGFATACILIALGFAMLPTVHLWWNSMNSGGAGMMLISVGLAIGAWALGRMQSEGGFSGKSSGNGRGDASGGAPPGGSPPHGGGGGGENGYAGGGSQSRSAPPPNGGGYTGGGMPNGNGYGGGRDGWSNNTPPPKPNGWQQRDEEPPKPQPQPSSGTYANTGANTNYNTGSTSNNQYTSSSNASPPPRPEPKRSGPSGWERAREETRRKEEERKKAAELQRQKEEAERKLRAEKEEAERKLRAEKEEAERKLKEAREKEQRERAAREEARERIAREAREARAARDAKIAQEKREKEEAAKRAAEAEAKVKAEAEKKKADAWAAAKAQAAAIQARKAAEKKRKEAEEEAAKKAAASSAGLGAGLNTERRQGSSYAYSAMGEKTNPWPKGYPTAPASVSAAINTTATPRATPGSAAAAAAARNARGSASAAAAARGRSPSPTKVNRPAPPPPNTQTYRGTESSYSYRPYDIPKSSAQDPTRTKAASSIYSGTSYAESDTTSATSAPPSTRDAYSTKDPDKIVMKAVYSFNNAHIRTPVTQLVSGTGSVTDGLILRITTEGLFIDDDVRHVPQREWDVKAWTLRLVEVGCPCFPKGFAAPTAPQSKKLFGNNSKNADKASSGLMGELAEKALVELLKECKGACRLGLSPASSSSLGSNPQGSQANSRGPAQTGQSNKLHVLRASIRDDSGKKYLFIIGEEEGWKIAVGLQRLRRGTQVRSLGVSGMGKSEVNSTLANLGWA